MGRPEDLPPGPDLPLGQIPPPLMAVVNRLMDRVDYAPIPALSS
jgi:hypothetical protein